MKLIEKCLLFGFFCAVLFSMLGFTAQCESIPDKVFRLHVLANSDSAEDQALKLRVRDRILEESAGLMDGVSTREEAEAAAAQSLPSLQAAAEDEIRQAGYGYSVQAEITRMYFPTRHYESVTLPAGEYDALRISIGEAKGKNWWCVLSRLSACLWQRTAPSSAMCSLPVSSTWCRATMRSALRRWNGMNS